MTPLPPLYPILDAETLIRHQIPLEHAAEQLALAGITLLQYRNKQGSPREILAAAGTLRLLLPTATLIMNDRPDLALLTNFDGVHVGQDDLSPTGTRTVLGPQAVIGLSTHTDEQLRAASPEATYLATGPIFSTHTKRDAAPTVGLEGLRRARALTARPLVAIGGITRANARAAREAGADSIALISALIVPGETIEKVTRDFLAILR